MKPVFLTNYDLGHIVLKYNVVEGTYEEILRTDIPPGGLKRGFYVKTDNNVVGYYPSPEGPIGFCNNQRFGFADVTCNVEPIIGTAQNEFSVSWNGQKQISVCYPPYPYRYYDNWSATEEDVDFFILLRNKSIDPDFYSYNTVRLE